MSKRKRKKHRVFYKAVKPFIKDSRVLYGMLGAVGVGMALGAVFGQDKAGNWLQNAVTAFKGLTQTKETMPESTEEKKIGSGKAPKKRVSAKSFAIEDI